MSKCKKALVLVLCLVLVMPVMSGFVFFSKTVTVQFVGTSVANDKEVVKAVNKRIDQLGLRFKFKGVWDDWGADDGYTATDTADNSIDVLWAASWPKSFNTYAANGAYVALDEYLAELPDLKAAIPQGLWDNFTVPGLDGERKIYGVPIVKEYANTYAWDINNTKLEELGFSFDDITWDENALYDPKFEEMLAAAKAADPNFYPLLIEPEPFSRHINTSEFDPTGTGMIHLGYDPKDPSQPAEVKASIRIEQPAYKKMIAKLQDFYKKGYINPELGIDAQSGTVVSEGWNSGNYLITTRLITPGFDASMSEARGIEVKSAIISAGVTPSSTQGAGFAVSVYSKNPKEAMQFLNALYTDRTLQTILTYGVEDIHWTDNGDGTITKTDKASEYSMWQAGVASMYTVVPTAVQGPYFSDSFKEFNEAAIPTSFNGFVFDQSPVANEIAALSSVAKEYNLNVLSGAADNNGIAEYLKVMKDNGIEKVLIELNRQLKAFYRDKANAAAAE
jgi:putative aldouronate transport system substrate-binding protein